MVESHGPRPVAIEFKGRTVTGSYKITRGVLTVTSDLGKKGAYLAPFATNPGGLARIMLRELAEEGKA